MGIIEQTKKVEEEVKKLEAMGGRFGTKAKHWRDSAFNRYPLAFLLLSSFGLVATLYGFEKVIDQVPFFVNNPRMILVTGLVILIITGSLYKRLSEPTT